MHHFDGLFGIATLGSFSRQHDAVSTVEDRIGDIGDLGAGRTGVVGHGFEHLCRADDGLAGHVAFGDHHLLSDEHLGGRNLDSQVTTSYHDPIGFPQNLVEIIDPLLVLDLGDDLDLLSLLTEDFANVLDVVCSSNEGCEDHVHVILCPKLEVINVFLGKRWQVNVCAREVDTFLR